MKIILIINFIFENKNFSKFISPFSLKARAFNQIKMGGKKDDITIIVAFIQEKIYRKSINKSFLQENGFFNFKRNSNENTIKNTSNDFIKNFENINLKTDNIHKLDIFHSNREAEKNIFLEIKDRKNSVDDSFH